MCTHVFEVSANTRAWVGNRDFNMPAHQCSMLLVIVEAIDQLTLKSIQNTVCSPQQLPLSSVRCIHTNHLFVCFCVESYRNRTVYRIPYGHLSITTLA